MSNIEQELTNLTSQQVRALASQYKVRDWAKAELGKLRRELLKLSEEIDILAGQRSYGQAKD